MTRIGVARRRRWASGPDQMLADMRFVGLYCDLDIPDASALSAALATITAAGPQTRLALTPATGKRLWRYGSAGVPPVHRLPDEVVSAGSEAIMEYTRNGPGDRQPLEVHVSQRHVAFDIDHGLGGGHLTIELMSAIAALCRGDASRWVATEASRQRASTRSPRSSARSTGTVRPERRSGPLKPLVTSDFRAAHRK